MYWSGNLISANGGYSTANDAMANEQLVRTAFKTWYNLPVVTKNGQPSSLAIFISYGMASAIYSNAVLSLGDGAGALAFPFTTRDIISHKLSHAFTEQYSNLGVVDQAGAVGEAFGDMTAKAIEFYVTGMNTWNFGADVMKQANVALRYMNTPSKDCGSNQPGNNCSIDNANEYSSALYYQPQYACGVFNRMFYLLNVTPGWNIKKAYDVFVAANMHYWTSTSTFSQAACGVVKATRDAGYNTNDVVTAFKGVAIDASGC